MIRATAKWPIWRIPPVAIALILLVDFAGALIPALFWHPITRSDIELSAALITLSVAYSAYTCSAERVRRTLHQGTEAVKYWNLLAIWWFTAAVMLPLQLMWIVAVTSAIAEWPARNVAGRARPYRHLYSTSAALLAASAAHLVSGSTPFRWLGILLATPVYIAVGVVLVGVAMLATGERAAVRGLLRLEPYRVEICCLAIAISMVLLADVRLGMLVWLSLPAAIGVQQVVTRSRLRRVADEALLQPMIKEAWVIAATEVVAALPVVAVIRITTAQPAAVSVVARIQAGCDAIGYLGADELGVLLVDCPALSAEALAARLRTAFTDKGIEANVAAAGKPRDGQTLNDLLAICEAELVARDAVNQRNKPLRPES